MTGPTGPTGPSGATGATGATPTITTAALMAHDETTSTVNTGNPILFTTTNLSSNVNYNPVNGVFTILQAGQYIIHWWANVKNSSGHKAITTPTTAPVIITLNQIAPAAILISSSSSHNSLAQNATATVNGNAVFTAAANSTFRLINSSVIPFDLVKNGTYSASISIIRNAQN